MTQLKRRASITAIRLATVAALTFSIATPVLAADVFFSGPSIAKANTAVTLSGGNFQPNSSVTLMVRAPGGQEAGYGAVVDPTGKVIYRITPTQAGAYTVTVTATSGQVLASATFHSTL